MSKEEIIEKISRVIASANWKYEYQHEGPEQEWVDRCWTVYSMDAEAVVPLVASVWDEAIEFFEEHFYGETTGAREHNPYAEGREISE